MPIFDINGDEKAIPSYERIGSVPLSKIIGMVLQLASIQSIRMNGLTS